MWYCSLMAWHIITRPSSQTLGPFWYSKTWEIRSCLSSPLSVYDPRPVDSAEFAVDASSLRCEAPPDPLNTGRLKLDATL